MTPFSVLDLAPVAEGSDPGTALRNARELAARVEHLGYRRFWMAEHHNMPGIASAATAVALAHVAEGTSTIRLGAGGIMLPNHSPLMVAEAFGTLAALHPGRIDLGVGRAPGTDMATARALRRNLGGDVDGFPQDVMELIGWFRAEQPGQRVRAVPGEGLNVPVWILGSSLYGAQLAAHLGLPYAFAAHFAPAELDHALAIYRDRFQPSEFLDKPYAMVAISVFAAETEREARLLATSQYQSFVNLRSGMPRKFPAPVEGYYEALEPAARAMLDQALSCAVIGDAATVRLGIDAILRRTQADELMVSSMMFDQAARLKSYEILAQARQDLAKAA